MNKIQIYDISSKAWYTQEATSEGGNEPVARYRFCSVSTSAADGSSYNIFIYGGQSITGPALFGDVHVLSIPGFHWIYLGEANIALSNHVCEKLQERYLLIYGGVDQVQDMSKLRCSGIQMFDMETLQWTTKYELKDPTSTIKLTYDIPKQIYQVIGGE